MQNLHKGLAPPIQDNPGQAPGSRFLHRLENPCAWEQALAKILRSDPDRFQTHSFEALSDAHIRGIRQRFLTKLSFSEIEVRELNIVQAMKDTFEWIYRDPRTNWSEWLAQGIGIYWITGKAGSGKSTLMKFLNEDPRTKNLIIRWRAGVPLYTAGFFFWNSGTEAQASYDGLLRALLSGILSANPALIPQLFPDRWSVLSLFEKDIDPWRTTELLRAFRKLGSLEYQAFSFFFFIDGLDEFSGDHDEIITMLQKVAKSPNIKICVSSRPWVVFQDAFDTNPSLMLQDLTLPDINHYIRTMFYGHSQFIQLEMRNPEKAQQLCRDVAAKSSGVFLWVRLVVRSLLEGISNGDRMSDLEARLGALPQDLSKLFHKMLMSVESPDCPTYIQHASQIFQIFRLTGEIDIYTLSLADEEDERALFRDSRPPNDQEISWRIQAMTRRLNSRTRGLLEVKIRPHTEPVTESLLQIRSTTEYQKRNKVQYLHRTVKDFIEKPDTWTWPTDQCRPPFDPEISLCKAHLLEAKFMMPENRYEVVESNPDLIADCMDQFLQHASLVGPRSYSLLDPLLGEMDKAATKMLGEVRMLREIERGVERERVSLLVEHRLAGILCQVGLLRKSISLPKAHGPGQERAFKDGAGSLLKCSETVFEFKSKNKGWK